MPEIVVINEFTAICQKTGMLQIAICKDSTKRLQEYQIIRLQILKARELRKQHGPGLLTQHVMVGIFGNPRKCLQLLCQSAPGKAS